MLRSLPTVEMLAGFSSPFKLAPVHPSVDVCGATNVPSTSLITFSLPSAGKDEKQANEGLVGEAASHEELLVPGDGVLCG